MKVIENIVECISKIIDVSNELGVKFYVYGGFVQDIMEGKLLRDHSDINIFMENMDNSIEFILKYLNDNGLEADYTKHWGFISVGKYYTHLKKDYVRIYISSIEFNQKNAIWKYYGKKGFMCFPKNWLDKKYRMFYNLKILTSGIKFEYCYRILYKYTKDMFYPKDKVEKHILALNYYEQKLREKNINPFEIFSNIWSYNPHYFDEWHKDFSPPVLVLGKDVLKNNHRSSSFMKEFVEKNKK